MNHDILITTTPDRQHLLERMAATLESAIEDAANQGIATPRLTLVSDGAISAPPIFDRVVQHRFRQGLAFAISEWGDYLALTSSYYKGESKRTAPRMSMLPGLCTILQDDAVIDGAILTFPVRHAIQIFGMADWWSGYDPEEHGVIGKARVGGIPHVRRKMGCAVHLTTSFEILRRRLPIPKTFGKNVISPGGADYAPGIERGHPSRSPKLGSRVEHWLQGDAPGIGHRGTLICPGLVRHDGGWSTWNG